MPFFSRLIFAIVAWFKILFDGEAAARMAAAAEGAPALPEAKKEEPKPAKSEPPPPPPTDAALQLLALLQREGRLVDFLEEDIAGAADADIGAAARVVHSGCRKALRAHVTLAPVRAEDEGAKVTLAEANPVEVKLTGNVAGKGPYSGVLRHRGWRATEIKLPTAVAGHDPRVVAQAEVEL
ncbi:MAG: DUF2760 domain-containing protein [Labilithrix sp.]|nr:DUF2760 domain-containing protein [Labilithrix sp.]MCW5815180.1 DUF2760 domain-containing protein [Labilithrix sp.]